MMLANSRRFEEAAAAKLETFQPTEAAADILTPREREIAMLVAKGFSNKEVGQILDISHWTVGAHLKACFLKLGMRRRCELAYALRDVI